MEEYFQNPIIVNQAIEESVFKPDPIIGHTLQEGKDFLGEKKFLSFAEVIQELKITKRKIILNMGDSSTSGWDSYVITENRKRRKQGKKPRLPFFQYKTYSDYIRRISPFFYVINAGVPAHTSLQGKLHLKRIIQLFKKERIFIDYATLYYGNNDCAWNLNREDKAWLEPSIIHTIKKLLTTKNKMITRVRQTDFEKNMQKMIDYCKKEKITPFLIIPPVPLYWKPGTRVKNDELPKKTGPGAREAYTALQDSLNIWTKGRKEKNKMERKELLKRAKELDYIVPRIKQKYIAILQNIAQKNNTHLIEIDIQTSTTDNSYFIDYCHPSEKTNILLAQSIFKCILQKEQEDFQHQQEKESKKQELPTENYTLY